MEYLKVIVMLIIVFMFKVESIPMEIEENHTKEKDKEDLYFLNRNINEKTLEASSRLHSVSYSSLKDFILNTKSTIQKIQTCNLQNKMMMFGLASLKFGNFEACINATRDIADYEQFFLHSFDYIVYVDQNLSTLIQNVIDCYNQTNIFEILKCALGDVLDNGPDFHSILLKAYQLISEVEDDTENLFQNVKKCFGFSTSELLQELMQVINSC